MDEVTNPFRPGAGAVPPALVGRDVLIDHFGVLMRRALVGRPGKSVMLIGLRGVGKTVLLNRFADIATHEGLHVAFIEAPKDGDLRVLLANRLRQVLTRIGGRGRTGKLLHALRVLKTFSLQLPDGSSFSLDVDALEGYADSGRLPDDLVDVLVAVGEALRERSSGLLLVVDEMQWLTDYELRALVSGIHRTTQRDLPVVLTGAGLPDLPGLAGKARSYAERLFEFPVVGHLDDGDAAAALIIPVQNAGADFTDEAVAAVVAATHGYSYFLQEWGYDLWNRAASPSIGIDDVTAARPEVVDRLDRNFFTMIFDPLTQREKDYLRAMAALGPGPHRSGDVAAALGKKVESVAPRRAGLISKGMVYSPAHGGTAFTVPLFDEFLVRAMPGWSPSR